MLNLNTHEKFVTLEAVLDKIKSDSFSVYLCKQDSPEDENVKMARFLPMDECRLGFSPTSSELLLYNHRGNLYEKLSEAFECLHNCMPREVNNGN